MSIITEALKKAQAIRSGEKVTRRPINTIISERHARSSGPHTRKNRTVHAGPIAVAIGFFIAAILILYLKPGLFDTSGKARDPQVMTDKTGSDVAPSPGTDRTMPLERPAPAPSMEQHTEEPAYREPELSGILYSAGSPQAVIDGKLFSEGDSVKGMEIRNILPEKVVLSDDGTLVELELE